MDSLICEVVCLFFYCIINVLFIMYKSIYIKKDYIYFLIYIKENIKCYFWCIKELFLRLRVKVICNDNKDDYL